MRIKICQIPSTSPNPCLCVYIYIFVIMLCHVYTLERIVLQMIGKWSGPSRRLLGRACWVIWVFFKSRFALWETQNPDGNM